VLGAGGDACRLLDGIDVGYDKNLDHRYVAGTLLNSALLPGAHSPADWPELWPTMEVRIEAFLMALERRSGASGLARRARSLMERNIGKTINPLQEKVESLRYQQLIRRIRETVRSRVTEGGCVLVVSRGDDDLLQIDPCRGSHFPQAEDGRYAGYHATDGAAAVQHFGTTPKTRGSVFPHPADRTLVA
jgi:hypothetical protein